jgi:hypothetical protein
MLSLSLLAPLAVELQTAPIQRFRDHKRIEVSSTFQAPWDYNLDNIIDNVRLSWFSRWNTGPVAHNVLLNYDKSKSQYNFNDATVKADVLKAFGGRLGYELKQVFAKKKRAGATSLLLKLTSPEVSGCEVQAEYDAMGRSLHALKPSVGLALGDRCRLRASSELVLATKAMKHVGAVQLFGTLENVDGSEVAALPLEVRGTLRSEGGESAGYEVAVEKQLGRLKGVGATLDAAAKEVVLELWASDEGPSKGKVMTFAAAIPYATQGKKLSLQGPAFRYKMSHLLF